MAHESSEKIVAELARGASMAGGVGEMGKGMMGPMMNREMMGTGMMGPMMGGMARDGMMEPMMGGMMGPMTMMSGVPMASSARATGMAMRGLASGVAASAGGAAGRSLAKGVLGHAVLFGLGIVAGYLIHKYRKEILGSCFGSTPADGPAQIPE